MADPVSATATQLRHIETKTGKSFAQLSQLITDSRLAKIGEQRKLLMDTLGLGHGDANMLALLAKESAQAKQSPASDDPLDAIYTGAKAHLRSLHEQLGAEIDKLGAHEKAPKKGYISLRRKKQFAMLGPATKDHIELGLNVKELPAAARLKALAPGGMCQYAVRLSSATEIDADLMAWLRAAYDSAA
jgi:hypothetical protein